MSEAPIIGCILGTAVGDALGLPYEGLSPRRAGRLLGPPDRYRLFFGRGMVSDDTEHTCMVAQALIVAPSDADAFARAFAWRLRFWLLGLPAGIGKATLRATLRLWLGRPPHKSGVFSAGNGPAMRAAILGAAISDVGKLRLYVCRSTRITHSNTEAEMGALAVALAAQLAARGKVVSPTDYLRLLTSLVGEAGGKLVEAVSQAAASVERGEPTQQFAAGFGLSNGVTGYIHHTVPVCIHAWLANPHDFRAAVTSVIGCGGDADTTAAIVGGIVGAAVGREGIPQEWLERLCEWPRTVCWMERLGSQLAEVMRTGLASRPVQLNVPALFARNMLFLLVVLFHGFRRLAPPY